MNVRLRSGLSAVLLLLPAVALAHRLDEYLQATRLSLALDRVVLKIDLTPGVDVAARVACFCLPGGAFRSNTSKFIPLGSSTKIVKVPPPKSTICPFVEMMLINVPLALVQDVCFDPVQVPGPEADHAVSGLPLQNLAAELLVDLVRGVTFELADQLRRLDGRGNGNAQMDVRLDAADRMNVDTWGVDALAAQGVVRLRLDLGDEQRRALLGVPGDVEVDLRVVVSRHGLVQKRVAKAEQREAP